MISPKGGRCEAYSSAKLMRFFAHISAMPSTADWKSALSAERRISAKEKEEMGGSALMRAWVRGEPEGVRSEALYVLTRTGEVMFSFWCFSTDSAVFVGGNYIDIKRDEDDRLDAGCDVLP